MRGRNLHLTGQLGGIDRLAGLLANQQFGQCWWSRQTANMTDQYAVGAHQHGRFLLHWTAEHHAATGCPRAEGDAADASWNFDDDDADRPTVTAPDFPDPDSLLVRLSRISVTLSSSPRAEPMVCMTPHWRRQSRANPSLEANFPASRDLTGNFVGRRSRKTPSGKNPAMSADTWQAIPYVSERET
jgi:hypothetical protein